MSIAFGVLALAIIWAAIAGNFDLPTLLLGALVGLVALWLVRDRVQRGRLLLRVQRAIGLTILFLRELLMSGLRVAWLVIQPDIRSQVRPAIVAYPLAVKTDAEITLLANLITLTPGTLSVDVSEDRRLLYIHALSVPDRQALIDDIAKGFEARIIEVFQ